uniref:G-protein coupled receptors family 1 profile domain-containing protein n=1 Tax=Clytia hemisphaerica TaxID=252671 RepID=A0A7M5VCC9_9CNID
MSYNIGNLTNTSSVQIFTPEGNLIYSIMTMTLVIAGIILNSLFVALYNSRSKIIKQNHFNLSLAQLSFAYIVQYIGFIPYVLLNVRSFSKLKTAASIHFLCGIKDGLSLFFAAANCCIYLLCSMTYTRYMLINKPLSASRFTKERCKRLYVIFWMVSIVSMIPNYLTLYAYGELPFCLRTYPLGESFMRFYGAITVLIGFVIPFLVLVLIYFMVVCKLYSTRNERCSNAGPGLQNQNKVLKKSYRTKVVKILGVVLGIFIICWLPMMCGWVLGYTGFYDRSFESEEAKARMYRFVLLPALCSGILSVLFNVFSNSSIRASIRRRKSYRFSRTVSRMKSRNKSSVKVTGAGDTSFELTTVSVRSRRFCIEQS